MDPQEANHINKRDQKVAKRRNGMRTSGSSVKLLATLSAAKADRARKALKGNGH